MRTCDNPDETPRPDAPPPVSARRSRSPRRRKAALGATVGVALLAAACGADAVASTPAASPPPKRTGPPVGAPNPRLVAEREALSLLARIGLPPGHGALSSTPPPGTPAILRQPSGIPGGTPYLVDLARYLALPGNPASVLSYIEHHTAGAGKPASHGTSADHGQVTATYVSYAFPTRHGLAEAELVVGASAVEGRTELRVDAEVVYVPLRPASERIPADARKVVLEVTAASGATRTMTITSRALIAELVSIVDHLGRPSFTVNPGGPMIPAPVAGEQIVVSFYAGKGVSPMVVVTDHPGLALLGLGSVGFSLDGRPQPTLSDPAGALPHLVSSITGIHFDS